jgi:hypothetical protein
MRQRKKTGFRAKEKIGKIMAIAAIGAASLFPQKAAAETELNDPELPGQTEQEDADHGGWLALRPGYVIGANQLTLRAEGGASTPEGTHFYAFADFSASEEDSAALDSFYSEMRVMRDIWGGLRLFAELDIGSGMDPVIRPGLMYQAVFDGWSIAPRLSPWSFGGANDLQISIYVNKTFADRIFTEILLDLNMFSATAYAEVAADILMPGDFSIGLGVTVFSDLRQGDAELRSIIRAGASF